MQKIIKQDLSGNEETAKQKAQYTWEKDEEAWYFCTTFEDVFKVKFTGEHWLAGNERRRKKIYQYEYLESSDPESHSFDNTSSVKKISHSEESIFSATKKQAIARGLRYIKKAKDEIIKECDEAKAKLLAYKKLK